MGLAPSGLKIGDIFEEGSHKYRVKGFCGDIGYDVEVVTDEEKQEDIPLEDLPFAPVDEEEPKEAPKKRGRKKAAE
jgi:hypothetical protein